MHIQKYFFIVLVILLLAGCNNDVQVNDLKSRITSLEKTSEQDKAELNKTKSASAELETQLKEANAEIARLKNEVEMNNAPMEVDVLAASDNTLSYVMSKSDQIAQTVTIIGYNIDGINRNTGEIHIDGIGSGELLKANVIGSIFDFELVEVEWDSSNNSFVEVRTIKKINEVTNKSIIINTTLPEGYPAEKIKWKDPEGKEYGTMLGYDGFGFAGSIIWNR